MLIDSAKISSNMTFPNLAFAGHMWDSPKTSKAVSFDNFVLGITLGMELAFDSYLLT